MSLKTFTTAYVEASLWSSTDEQGRPFDENYGPADIAPNTKKQMEKNARDFYLTWNEWWSDEEGYGDEQAGHDFWLTRNGHGAGFWDRGLKNGKKLTDAALAYGSFDLYVGDDGKVHGS